MIRTSPNIHRVTYFNAVTKCLFSILLTWSFAYGAEAQSDDTKIVSSDRASDDLLGKSVSISGDYAIVGAPYEDEDAFGENTLSGAGSAYIYKQDAMGNWQQLKKLVASDRASPDEFGWSVAIAGDLAIVGALRKYEDNETIGESGAAYIFQKDQGGTDNWGEVTKIKPADRDDLDYFGISVAISNEYAIVGAYQEDEDQAGLNTINNSGSAYIFKKDEGGANNWGELTKIVASDRDEGDEFGFSVTISGDYAVVGARYDEHDAIGSNPLPESGSAYVFQKDQGGADNWGEIKKLVASDRSVGSNVGWSVAMSGNNILVGANGRGAYLFTKDEGGANNWGEMQKLLPHDFQGKGFGRSVSMDGDHVLIGAPEENRDKNGDNELSSAGAAYLFFDAGDTWSEAQKFVATDRASGDSFGEAVGITSSGESIVGATRQDEDTEGGNSQNDAGAAYLFPSKSVQTITFEALPSKTYGDASFTLTATSSSGLPIEFATANASNEGEQGEGQGEGSDPTVVSISGNTVTITSAGTIDIIASQAGDETYWSASKAQSLVVSKKLLIVTADDQSRDYRAAEPEYTFSYSGFIEGEDENDLDFLPEVALEIFDESSVGAYPIELSGAFDDNYEFNYVNGTLTINSIPLQITADSYIIAYGEYPPEDPTFSYTGLVEGDSFEDPDISIDFDFDDFNDVGTYLITIGGVTEENYSITFVDGTLTIIKADLTISADGATYQYGSDPQTNATLVYSGFVNGDNEGLLDVLPVVTTSATATSPVGSYFAALSGGSDSNYNFNLEEGMLEVLPAFLTITADDQTSTYGDTDLPALTVSYEGFVNNEDESVLATAAAVSTSVSANTDAGAYPIMVSGATATNYTITHVDGELTIAPAILTVTVGNQTSTYGDTDLPALTASYAGFVNGENESVLTTAANVSTSVSAGADAGDYPVIVSGATAPNYVVTHLDGELTIAPAPLIVTADDQTSTYGDSDLPTLTVSYAGFVNDEDESVFATAAAVSTSVSAGADAGGYPIMVSGATATNYTITHVDGELTITPAPLIVTADDQMSAYGDTNLPTLTVRYAGFVNNEDESVFTTAATVSTSVTANTDVGDYPIVASGTTATNYTITHVDGELTITPATLTVTADDQTSTYGDTDLPALTISYAGFVNGENESVLDTAPLASTTVNASSSAGTYSITTSGGADKNYSFIHLDGVLTVGQAELTATADDFTINAGDALPTFTITYSGLVNGENETVLDVAPTASVVISDSSVPGSYEIALSAGSDNNYSFGLVSGTLIINKVLGIPNQQVIKVFPNPVVDYMTISSEKVSTIEIYDLRGTQVFSSVVKGKVDLHSLERGNYVIHLKDEGQHVLYTTRVIKN